MAFLSFFLGTSLLIGSIGSSLGRIGWGEDPQGWWQKDWQETPAFRDQVCAYLEDFLTMAAGGPLRWYHSDISISSAYASSPRELLFGQPPAVIFSDTAASSENVPYQADENVLYRVLVDGEVRYENAQSSVLLDRYETLPQGYNFLLTFQNGKASIIKDGSPVDVYGNGIYDETSLWFLPGYDNFKAGTDVEDVKVELAVRETPVPYYQGDYANGTIFQNYPMYQLYSNIQESQQFYQTVPVCMGIGVCFLLVWFLLRKDRQAADQKIASWTIHVWTEFRVLAVVFCLLFLLMDGIGNGLWLNFYYEGFQSYLLIRLLLDIASCLGNLPALLGLWWILWLLHNDHRCHPRSQRRSLWKLVGLSCRKYAFEKRMNWRNRITMILVWLLAGSCFLLLLDRVWYDLSVVWIVFPCLIALLATWTLHKNALLAQDTGFLSDQVAAIRSGNLEKPLQFPKDAELQQTAEHLNDIQSGMHQALEKQTRSEKLKVELISNVSHDLKTPLTSILSYADLLLQEDLPPAAKDYARIIDEKAQRLKTMVQDVFEVSKAAADQLPVHLERLDLGKLLHQTLADMEDPIQKSSLLFKLSIAENVDIIADGRRLYRVFQNLIQNALQYSLEGSRVFLSLKIADGRAEASIRNTSRTELPEDVDFTARFVRGDESRTDGGSGLGLSIAQSFTEACGGTFRVEMVADLFTAVVSFPLAREDPSFSTTP